MIYSWVYIYGSVKEAQHFSYTLKLFGSKATTTFEGKVAAIDESFESLKKSGKCFTLLHDALVSQFLDENSTYEGSVEIRNLKEQVKDENYESGISDNEVEDSKMM